LRTLLVTDTNILIDLLTVNLEGLLFQIGAEICTTDFVMGELTQNDERERMEKFEKAEQLRVVSFEDVGPILTMPIKRNGLKIADRSALFVAQQEKAVLLSGDGDLRKEAQEKGGEVHGAIWLFEIFVEQLLIAPNDAYEVLAAMLSVGRRLPEGVIEGLAVKWGVRN
jgi:predicted nucleic acid-binding protein